MIERPAEIAYLVARVEATAQIQLSRGHPAGNHRHAAKCARQQHHRATRHEHRRQQRHQPARDENRAQPRQCLVDIRQGQAQSRHHVLCTQDRCGRIQQPLAQRS